MKKIKKISKKHISFILSAALIIGILFPITNLFTKASDPSEADLVSTLKSEWVKMDDYYASVLYANRYRKSSEKTVLNTTAVDKATLTDVLPSGAKLGNNINTVAIGEAITDATNDERSDVIIEASNKGVTNYLFSEMDDIVFWFKVNSGNADFTVAPVNGNWKTAMVLRDNKTFNLSNYTVGEWNKFSFKENYGENWKSLLKEKDADTTTFADVTDKAGKIARVSVNFGKNASAAETTADVTFGSVYFTKKAALPEGSDSWDGTKWINYIKTVDFENTYGNYDGVISTYTQLKVLLQGDPAFALKEAWGKLQVKSDLESVPFRFFNSSGAALAFNKEKENYPDLFFKTEQGYVAGPDGVDLGNGYNKLNISASSSDFGHNTLFGEFIDTNGNNTKKLAAGIVKDAFFWYKADGTSEGATLKFRINVGTNRNFEVPATANIVADGEWHKISLLELLGEDWADSVTYNGTALSSCTSSEAKDEIFRFMVSINNSSSGSFTMGAVHYTTACSLPSGSDTWEVIDWLKAALALDLSNYYNTAEFETELVKLANEYAAEVAAYNLREAWGKLQIKNNLESVPYRFYNSAGTVAAFDKNTYKAVYPDLSFKDLEGYVAGPEGIDLGNGYNTLNITASSSDFMHNTFLAEFFDSKGNIAKRLTAGLARDAYFWYKADGTDEGATLKFRINVGTNRNFEVPATVAVIADGEWHKVSLYELLGENWNESITCEGTPLSSCTSVEAANEIFRFIVSVNNSAAGSFTMSAVHYNTAYILTDEQKNAKPADLALMAKKFDRSSIVGGDIQAFENALAALMEEVKGELAIVNIKDAWKEPYKVSNTGKFLNPIRFWNSAGEVKPKSDANYPDYKAVPAEGLDGASKDKLGNYVNTLKITNATSVTDEKYFEKNTMLLEDEKYGATFSKNLYDITVWYKAKNASANTKFAIKLVPQRGGVTTEIGTFSPVVDGAWHKLSMREIFGENWSDKLGDSTSAVLYRMYVNIQNTTGEFTFGSAAIDKKDILAQYPSNTDSWNIADWAHEAGKVNLSGFENTDNFKECLRILCELRDQNNISRSSTRKDYSTAADFATDFNTVKYENNILNKATLMTSHFDGLTYDDNFKVNESQTALLKDAILDTDVEMQNANYGIGAHTDFIYKFNGDAVINDIVLVHSQNEALRNAKISVYASDNIVDISSPASLLANIDNSEGKQVNTLNFDGFSTVDCNYLMIRVEIPAKDMQAFDSTIRFAEIGVYGDVVAYTVKSGNYDNVDLNNIGTNLLAGNTKIKIQAGTFPKQEWSLAMSTYKISTLTDNDPTTRCGFYGTTKISAPTQEENNCSMYLSFDLGRTYTIDKVFVNGCSDLLGGTQGAYEFYASTEVNNLTTRDHKVFSYDNTATGDNTGDATQVFSIAGGGVIARHIAFRFTKPLSNPELFAKKYGDPGYALRLADVGVCGTVYNKPLKLVNLLAHVPMTLYRGLNTSSPVGESEYSGATHMLASDDNFTTVAPVSRKGKALNYVYDLSADQKLTQLKIATQTANIKHIKIYASDANETIWHSDKLVYEYNGAATDVISKYYDSAPLAARFLRFEILDTVSDTFDPLEIQAIGWNTQEFTYMNFMQENQSAAYLMTEQNGQRTIANTTMNKFAPSWTSLDKMYTFSKAFDFDFESVADIYGGSVSQGQSLNFLFDLETTKSVDQIIYRAGSYADYWPTNIKFYMGTDDAELFKANAVPIKTISKTDVENGIYEYTFVPKAAQFIRIEIEEAACPYYDPDKIGLVIAEMIVNGLEQVGRVDENGYAKVFEDTASKIQVGIVARNENDAYSGVSGVETIKRAPDTGDLLDAKEKGYKILTDIYEIYLLDNDGNIITDIDGRSIDIKIPTNIFDGKISDEYFVAQIIGGSLTILECDIVDGYYVIRLDSLDDLVFTLVMFTEYHDEDSDTPDDEDYEEFDDEEDSEEPDDDGNGSSRRVKKIIVRRGSSDFEYWWIFIVVGAVVVAAAGGACYYFFIFKKRKKGEE